MREIDALSRLPLPTQPPRSIECDEVLFQELIVAREVGHAIGSTLKMLPQDSKTGEIVRTFTGRLTEAGLAHLQALQAADITSMESAP